MRSAPCPRRSVEPSVAFEPEAWGILEVRGVTAPPVGGTVCRLLGERSRGPRRHTGMERRAGRLLGDGEVQRMQS